MKGRRGSAVCLSIVLACCIGGDVVHARVYEVKLKSSDVVLTTASGAVVVETRIPKATRNLRIDFAVVEFYVDQGVNGSTFLINFSPVSSFSTSGKTFTVKPGNWPGCAGVRKGSRQLIRMDITSMVREWAESSETVHGVLHKAPAGDDQDLSIDPSALGSETIAVIKIYATDPR